MLRKALRRVNPASIDKQRARVDRGVLKLKPPAKKSRQPKR